jgi:hypothetical protein
VPWRGVGPVTVGYYDEPRMSPRERECADAWLAAALSGDPETADYWKAAGLEARQERLFPDVPATDPGRRKNFSRKG